MRMVEGRRGFGILDEAAHPIRVLRECRGQHLDRDPAVQTRVFGQVDLAHASLADRGEDPVMGERRIWFEAHGGRAGFPGVTPRGSSASSPYPRAAGCG